MTLSVEFNVIHNADALSYLETMGSSCVDCCITSPPYYRERDYQIPYQLGREKSIREYVLKLGHVFDEVYRVVSNRGGLWIVIGDKIMDGIQQLIPAKLVEELAMYNWVLRRDIIWHKKNRMPQPGWRGFSLDYEHVLWFTKKGVKDYYFKPQFKPYSPVTLKEIEKEYTGKNTKDYKAHGAQPASDAKRNMIKSIRMPPIGGKKQVGQTPLYSGNQPFYKDGAFIRAVWDINTQGFKGSHYAVYPEKLVSRIMESACPPKGVVLDPFMGSGTTAVVAKRTDRSFIGIELNPSDVRMAYDRLIT